MSKPRRHMATMTGDALCGRYVLDRTTVRDNPQLVTCKQCLQKMTETQFDEADHRDPEAAEGEA